MKKLNNPITEDKWNKLKNVIQYTYQNKSKLESNLAFKFMEGSLLKAIKQGDWILIDEINLANNDVL